MNWCYAILSYNHNEHTRNCIRSILSISPNATIYIIHNGTESKQRQIIENEFGSIKTIIPIIIENNQGYSGGLNLGLGQIFEKENFVFVLTNDTELVQVPTTDVRPSVIVPLILNKRNKKIDSLGGYFIPSKGHLYHNKNLTAELNDSTDHLSYVPGSAFLIDKESFLKTNGFWTQLGTYWEDVEWSQRLKHLNCPLNLNSDFKLFHKIGKTCHKDTFYTTYLYQRNRLVVSWSYVRGFNKIILIFYSLSTLIKWTFKSILKSNYPSLWLYLRSLWDAIKMIKEYRRRPQHMS